MKKVYLLVLMVCALFSLQAQNNCAAPFVITSIPFSSGTVTTCGTVDDFPVGSYFTGNYGAGEDYVYSYTVTNAPVTLNFALGGTAVWKILSIHSACPPTAANAIGGITTGSGASASTTVTFSTNGTYYFIIDTWPTPACGEFSLNVTVASPPPANDVCSGATLIPVGATCTATTYSTNSATANNETGGCAIGSAANRKDVWFKFIATAPTATVTVKGSTNFDAVIGAISACGSATRPTGGDCTDATLEDQAEILNLSGLTTGATYYIQVYDYQGDNDANATFTICVQSSNCATPTGVATGSVTSNSASVSWTGTGNYVVEYGPAGFTPGAGTTAGTNGTVITNATSPQVIPGLNPVTAYSVYVRQVCSGPEYSLNSPVSNFTTTCAISSIPYTMPIETASSFGIPSCTTVQDVNADANTWYAYTGGITGFTGNVMVYEYSETSSANDWLFTNGLNLTANTSYRLTFKYNNDASTTYPEKMRVGLGTLASAGSMTILADYPSIANTTPQNATIDFVAPTTGVYYVGFQAYSAANMDVLLLDDVLIDVAPACSAVSGLVANNITATAANISWAGTGNFILEYGPAGYTPGTGATAGATGTLINPATSPQALGGLTPATGYDVYVRRDCGGGTYSANSPKITFTTTPIQFISIASGNWNATTTWAGGVLPGCSDNVVIANGHTVTVNSAGNVSGTVTVNTGATLLVSSGNVTVGCTNRNSSFVNNGTLNVSGGNMLVNGSVLIANASSFTQSGGTITVDGNNGGTTATSVTAASGLFSIGNSTTSYSTGTISLTGGTILITDPHAAGGFAFVYYGGSSTANNLTAGVNHILKFGDGVSTDPGTTVGFNFNQWEANSLIKMNVVVDGGTGTNRTVISNYSPSIYGNLTVQSGQMALNGTTAPLIFIERDLNVAAGASLTSNGTFRFATGTVDPVAFTVAESANTIAQAFGGTGTLSNSATTRTADLVSFTINNTSTSGVTLNRPLNISGTLTLTAGNLNTTTTNLMTVGINTTTRGTITRTGGKVVGPIKKWVSGTGSTTLPLGTAITYKPAVINFTTAPTTGGTLTARFSATAPSFPNATPLTEGALTVNSASAQGSWFIEAGDGLTGGTYTGTFTGTNATDVIDYTKTVLIKRPSAGGDWTLSGTHVTSTGSNTSPVVSRTTQIGFSEFAIGGQANVALPIIIEYFNGAKQGSANALNWKVNSTEPSVNIVLERSADGRSYSSINAQSATAARCLQPFNYDDVLPAATNYYRLKVTQANGRVAYSNVVVLLNRTKGFEFAGMLPNPVSNASVLQVSSANNTTMEITITDIVGKVISKQTIAVTAGVNKIPMQLGKLAAGSYQVTGRTADGELKTIRFVKQ